MQTIRIENTHLTTSDGCQIATTIYHPHNINGQVVVFNSAMGTPQEYYNRFAHYLGEKGYTCVSYDYRGIGASVQQPISPKWMELRNWGERDFEAVLSYVKAELHPSKLIVFGHSCGGQILGLAPSAVNIDAIIFTTVQSAYWKHWSGLDRYKIALLWHVAMPLLSIGSYFPAKALGLFSLNIPSGIARTWCQWGRSPDYLFDPVHNNNTSHYAKIKAPVLALSFEDDKYAPKEAVDALLEQYSGARIKRRHVKPADIGASHIGHFGFYDEYFMDTLWQEAMTWLQTL